jgi:cell wall-associated NlpC family hydrolase
MGLGATAKGTDMAIDPLYSFPPLTTVAQGSAATRKTIGASPFDALLDAVGNNSRTPSPVKAQQAAAELLRMEMMQHSLSLSGEEQAAPPPGLQALQSLLCGTGGVTAHPAPALKGNGAAGPEAAAGAAGETAGHLSTPADPKVDGIDSTAAEFLGTPYRFGGEGANGIDCSSFVQQVFREHQIELPRTAREQIRMGSEVARGDLKKGDLVFFHTYASFPSHVGIYMGEGKMIHASSAKGEVTVSDINSDYYRSHFIGAKRVA